MIDEEKDLLPCPFCGDTFRVDSCDRLIQVHCDTCEYHRYFNGLVSPVKNDKPITKYKDDSKKTFIEQVRDFTMGFRDEEEQRVKEIPEEEATEFYHAEAYEIVIEQMNKRYEGKTLSKDS